MHVSGHFAPSAPPMSPHRREIGEHCIVELKQRYEVAGDLAGTMDVDLRIYVAGRCGSPPGTFDEHWIAYGTYNMSDRKGPLIYLAEVQAGGRVKGRLIFSGDLEGTLTVEGGFEEGSMSYSGDVGGT
jgi:hypothetical protein